MDISLKEEIRNLEEQWAEVNQQFNAITQEAKQLNGEQAALCNELKQKKNLYREKQVCFHC